MKKPRALCTYSWESDSCSVNQQIPCINRTETFIIVFTTTTYTGPDLHPDILFLQSPMLKNEMEQTYFCVVLEEWNQKVHAKHISKQGQEGKTAKK